jgi:hypothetical protein
MRILSKLLAHRRAVSVKSVYLNNYKPLEGRIDAEFADWLVGESASPQTVAAARRIME